MGIFLYVFTVLFFCLQSFKKAPDPHVWNNLFWVVLIFSAINSTSKNFVQYNRGRFIYLYTVCKPEHFIIAKMLYTILFMLFLTTLTLMVYGLFLGFEPLTGHPATGETDPVTGLPNLGSPGANKGLFILTLFLGTVGFAAILSFMSVLTVRANASMAITAILSIPLLIPLIISINELCALSLNQELTLKGLSWELARPSLLIAAACDLLVLALGYVLFPYLWRE